MWDCSYTAFCLQLQGRHAENFILMNTELQNAGEGFALLGLRRCCCFFIATFLCYILYILPMELSGFKSKTVQGLCPRATDCASFQFFYFQVKDMLTLALKPCSQDLFGIPSHTIVVVVVEDDDNNNNTYRLLFSTHTRSQSRSLSLSLIQNKCPERKPNPK